MKLFFSKNMIITSIFSLGVVIFSPLVLAKTQPVEAYIIKFNNEFKGNTNIPKGLLKNDFTVKFKKTYNSVFSGVVVNLTKKQAKFLLKKPFVDTIEKDTVSSINANWGLDRIDQNNLPLNGSFNVIDDGNGANIYILDTGININHNEFSGRIGTVTSTIPGGTQDCHGHGTHVASIAAGKNFGVAPNATINSIRIANCQGKTNASDMIEALEWIVNYGKPNSVINISYGNSSSLIRDAMHKVILDGHFIVTSAGNSNLNSCYDPLSKYNARYSIMVGSSTSTDKQSWFSNYGSCVDIYAPGSHIQAANYSSNTGTRTESGTSMAAPFVAGLAAGYRSTYPNATPNEVAQAIVTSASLGKLTGLGAGSPNKLAHNNLTVPSVYWQATKKISMTPAPNITMPFGPCTAGQKALQTLAEAHGRPGLYYARVWKCE